MEPEKAELEAMWLLRNPGKPLPNSDEAKAMYQKYLAEEKILAAAKKAKRDRRMMIKKGVINVMNADDSDNGDNDDDESSKVEEVEELPDEVDGAQVNYGYDMIDEELEEDAESEEDPNVNDSILESWKGDFDKSFWIDKFHPKVDQGEDPLDVVPHIVLKLSKCDIEDYKYMIQEDEEMKKRLEDREKWVEDDYDPTIWADRGAGRMIMVGYERRKAGKNVNTRSLYISRLVQNNKLVTFHMRSCYDTVTCIPFTQLIIMKKGDGAFIKGKRPYWAMDDHERNVSEEVKKDCREMPAVDLAELVWYGNFGMKQRHGEKRIRLSEEEKQNVPHITPVTVRRSEFLYVSIFRFCNIFSDVIFNYFEKSKIRLFL